MKTTNQKLIAGNQFKKWPPILLYWQRQYGTTIAEIREIFDLQKAFDRSRLKYAVAQLAVFSHPRYQ